jgi:hypothetical protein
VYVPIANALDAVGKKDEYRNLLLRRIVALENHLRQVPEVARARILLAADYAELDRVEDAIKELNPLPSFVTTPLPEGSLKAGASQATGANCPTVSA